MSKGLEYKYGRIFVSFILILLFPLLITINSASAKEQVISVLPNNFYQPIGNDFTLTVKYNVTDGNKYLTGLGINIHFNSRKFDYKDYIDFLNKGDMNSVPSLLEDTTDDDNDQDTDMKINISWVSISSQWPSIDLPVVLAELNFRVKQDTKKENSPINISVFEHDADYSVTFNSTIITVISQ